MALDPRNFLISRRKRQSRRPDIIAAKIVEDLQAALAQVETRSLPILTHCFPRSYRQSASDPSMSLNPFAPLHLGCSRSARPLPRGVTGHVAHP